MIYGIDSGNWYVILFNFIQVVNVFTLWTILLLVDYRYFSLYQLFVFIGLCCAVIVYETILGVVRVHDYFYAVFAMWVLWEDILAHSFMIVISTVVVA